MSKFIEVTITNFTGSASVWINPDRVVFIAPKTTSDGTPSNDKAVVHFSATEGIIVDGTPTELLTRFNVEGN